jgi:hypothetical protein
MEKVKIPELKSPRIAIREFALIRECQARKPYTQLVYPNRHPLGRESMKRNHVENAVLPNDWTNVLENVQLVLTQTAKAAAEREHRLVQEVPTLPKKEKKKAWNESREHFENRLRLFQSTVQKAEEDAEEADLALADAEKGLEYWLARAGDTARKVDQLTGGKKLQDEEAR